MKTSDYYFDLKWKLDPETGCHLWTAAVAAKGYGSFSIRDRVTKKSKHHPAHKFAYERKYGAVPKGMVLDHFRCDTPRCCNPDHVRPTSQRENILRGKGLAAINAAKTHCHRGHEFTEENTRIHHGARECRACVIVRQGKTTASTP